jgi:imidazolonepropionase-like amidohydrolase/predicted alpha/beta superfamily hydrolase
MSGRSARFFLLLLVLAAAGNAHASQLILRGAKIYPSPTDAPIENASVLIHEGKIRAVGPDKSLKIPAGATIIDCRGMIVTAGFWNSHVHILDPRLLHVRDSSARELNDQLDRMFNAWGFTTVYDIASVLDNTLSLRRRIESGELRGPRILTVGEPIWTIEPVYVRNFLKENHIEIPNTDTPEEALARVRDHAAKGANGIKLFTGSYQGMEKVAVLPLPVAKAAVDQAHRHRMPVFAHPQDVDGANVAIESGIDVLAHTIPQSPPWSAEFIARLKRANIALIPTLGLFDYEARKEPSSDEEREGWISQMVAELGAYSGAGGDILFGTDIGYTDQYDTALEFKLMSKAGMTFQQILASLTTNPARKFGYADRSGIIAKGMDADLVVLATDPSKNATAFSNVRYTIRNGRVTYSNNQGQSQSSYNVEILTLHSKIFNNTRNLRVWLPPDYPNQPDRKFPVFYFTDGVAVFHGRELASIADKLIRNREIPPAIFVGIDNGGSTPESKNPGTDRANEYLPYPDEFLTPPLPHPQGKRFPAFLEDEVRPLIESRYRTNGEVGLAGASYGGAIALYTVLERPGHYRWLLLESPSLYIANDELLRRSSTSWNWPARVYIGAGSNEGEGDAKQEMVHDVNRLKDIVQTRASVCLIVVRGAEHNEDAWRARLPAALRFLLAGEPCQNLQPQPSATQAAAP